MQETSFTFRPHRLVPGPLAEAAYALPGGWPASIPGNLAAPLPVAAPVAPPAADAATRSNLPPARGIRGADGPVRQAFAQSTLSSPAAAQRRTQKVQEAASTSLAATRAAYAEALRNHHAIVDFDRAIARAAALLPPALPQAQVCLDATRQAAQASAAAADAMAEAVRMSDAAYYAARLAPTHGDAITTARRALTDRVAAASAAARQAARSRQHHGETWNSLRQSPVPTPVLEQFQASLARNCAAHEEEAARLKRDEQPARELIGAAHRDWLATVSFAEQATQQANAMLDAANRNMAGATVQVAEAGLTWIALRDGGAAATVTAATDEQIAASGLRDLMQVRRPGG